MVGVAGVEPATLSLSTDSGGRSQRPQASMVTTVGAIGDWSKRERAGTPKSFGGGVESIEHLHVQAPAPAGVDYPVAALPSTRSFRCADVRPSRSLA